jgi:hypothetical protein
MCVKKAVFISVLCAIYLYGANTSPQSIVNEVANLRQKYEECRQEQKNLSPSDPAVKIKGYQTRISNLENQIKQNNSDLLLLKKQNTETERELSQKRGVVQSLEHSLTLKDQQLRDSTALSERLSKEANGIKVGKIERESMKNALVKAKADAEKLENSMVKSDQEVMVLRVSLSTAKAEIEKLKTKPLQAQSNVQTPPNTVNTADQSSKIKALQSELAKANALNIQLQKAPQAAVAQERIVTRIVEPTEKITELQRELSVAQTTIANLKKGVKTVTQEKVVEKVVYKDRPVIQEKIVEKVVYKDRPVVQEKVVIKAAAPTEQLNKALNQKLAQTPKLTPPKVTKIAVAAVPEKAKKVTPVLKVPVAAVSETPKKSIPSAYRMASNAPVYNAPSGSVVDTWEARRSFTSGTASNGWIKITGYFVNRVWTRADEELWVKESDVIRR